MKWKRKVSELFPPHFLPNLSCQSSCPGDAEGDESEQDVQSGWMWAEPPAASRNHSYPFHLSAGRRCSPREPSGGKASFPSPLHLSTNTTVAPSARDRLDFLTSAHMCSQQQMPIFACSLTANSSRNTTVVERCGGR